MTLEVSFSPLTIDSSRRNGSSLFVSLTNFRLISPVAFSFLLQIIELFIFLTHFIFADKNNRQEP